MKTISKHIGKDLRITWPVTVNGSTDLSGADLTLEMVNPYGSVQTIDFNREDGKIWFIFYGMDQSIVGNYTFTLWYNKGKKGQSVVDQLVTLNLVRHTSQEFAGDGECVQEESVELGSSNMDVTAKGDPGMSVYELAKLHGFTGTEEEYLASLKGERGPIGLRGPQGPQGATGLRGIPGEDGHDATINGYNTINIVAGTNVHITQYGDTLAISAVGGNGGSGSSYDDTELRNRIDTIERKEDNWDSKQDSISDLETIRSGAALGATALQTYTETDPVFSESPAKNITTANIIAWNGKADKPTIATTLPTTLVANTFYNLGTITGSKTIALPSSRTATDEFMIQFTTSTTAPTITWPSGVTWLGGAPTINASKTYQVSIQNNLGIIAEF